MKIFPFILIFLVVGDCLAMSNDSLRLKKSFPVVIKEEQSANVKGKKYIPISVVTDSIIHKLQPQQVDEILSIVPGLFIQNYGGLGGMKSISIRGTNSSQSVIMIEGIRINSSQNGMIDLSTIPTTFIQSIEVTRTGSSALYGANAIGGAINFRMENILPQKPNFLLNRSSFDTYSATTKFGLNLNNFVTNVSLNGITSRGNYHFTHNEFGETTTKQRENGDFHQFSGIITSTYSPSPTSSFTSLFTTTGTERGVPGAVVQGSIENKNARLKENDYFLAVIGRHSFSSTNQFDTKVWFKNNTFVYNDPEATLMGINGIFARYEATDFGLQSNGSFSFENQLRIESQLEMISTSLEGFSLEDGETITPTRNSLGFSTNISTPILHLFSVPFQFFTGLRYDYISDQNNAISPMISLAISASENIKLRTSYSFNYRPPSFNEMYYLNFGNRNLLSERSHSTTLGIDASITSFLSLSADIFSIRTSNLILSVPSSPVAWSAQNIGVADNNGIEITTNIEVFDQLLSFNNSVTFQNVVDKTTNSFTYNLRIPYTPTILSSTQILSSIDNFSAGIMYVSSGNRYSLQGNQSESLLPFFYTLSMFIEYQQRVFPLLLATRFQSDNLTNQSYTVIRNFPTPGRTFRFTLGATWL